VWSVANFKKAVKSFGGGFKVIQAPRDVQTTMERLCSREQKDLEDLHEDNIARVWERGKSGQYFFATKGDTGIIFIVTDTAISIDLACRERDEASGTIQAFLDTLETFVQTFEGHPTTLYLEAFYRSLAAWKNKYSFEFERESDRAYYNTEGKIQDAKEVTVPELLKARKISAFDNKKLTTAQANIIYLKMSRPLPFEGE
jgi:hypothetical protein